MNLSACSRAGRATLLATTALLSVVVTSPASAQYFGQNKVQYEKLNFQTLKTPHFDIYFYPEEKDAAELAGRLAERWYARLTTVLHHELTGRQPLVLFASHPHFAQTNVVEGAIDESTGGVTEGMQRRIALPLGATLADTDHVIGHELVHAFQYDILGPNASAPLWFIEGMAEYLSVGPVSTQAAMWLRDAALSADFPGPKDLDNPRYFPYRFGHAFWAYVAGLKGDDVVGDILKAMAPTPDSHGQTSSPGEAIEQVTGEKVEVLASGWKEAVISTYGITETRLKNQKIKEFWPAIIAKATGSGRVNVGPSLSPDGQRIAFLSERSRLAIEAYVADANNGRILTRLTEMDVDPHFESLQFLDSAGTWSPDGKRLCFAAIRRGRPLLAILDADNGKVLEEFKFDTMGEIFQPAWSPDGKSIAFAGHVGGFTDIFVYNLETKATARLTQDMYSDMSPAWSPDGRTLAFVTDRFTSLLDNLFFGDYTVATIDAAGGEPHVLNTGLHGDQVNPQWTPDGNSVVFVSNAAGAPNVYRVAAAGGAAEKLTTANTGITGITDLSAAISVAAHADRMAVTTFLEGGYDIHVFPAIAPMPPDEPGAKTTSELPPVGNTRSTVAELLQNPTAGLPPVTPPEFGKAGKGLHLVGFSQAAGVGVSSAYGAQLVGGASFLFSDVLGDHLLSVSAQAAGGVRDIGAQAFYLNRENRWYWGIEGGTIPLSSALASSGTTTINGQPVFVQQLDIFRQTNTEVGVLTSYPISRASRIEFSSALRHIGFSREIQTQIFSAISGELLSDEKIDQAAPESINMVDAGAAIIRDTAAFGGTGPVRGQRVRLEVAPAFGDLQLTTVTADYRQYFMPVAPVTFAVRGLHLGRYGAGAEDSRLTPLFIGYPSLVRGYDTGTWRVSECTPTPDGSCPEFDRLQGSRMFVTNFEVRAPLVGLFKRRLEYGPVPVEVFGFFDAGLAWTRGTRPSFNGGTQDWATSAGAGARVNVFGYLIAEVDMIKPFNRNRGFQWAFLLRPSW